MGAMVETAAQPVPAKNAVLWPVVTFVIVALDLLGLYAYLGRRIYLDHPVSVYLFLYATLFLFYVYAAGRLVPRLPASAARWAVPAILVFGVLFRLSVLPAPPSLSTDMYRYAWDGRLTLHGINPYRWAPNAPGLRSLRDPLWEVMEYKPYQTIYMPVSQAVFALNSALFGSNLIGYKCVYGLFDVGVVWLLLRFLYRLGRAPTQVIWYAWCPLPITEVSLAGHQDIVGVFFLLLCFWLALRPRSVGWAALALVASVLTKGFALLLLPVFCRTFGRRFTLCAAAALLCLGVPIWVCLPQFLHGMTQYLDNVHANAGLFYFVNLGLTPLTRFHYGVAKALSDLAILGVVLWSARRPAETIDDLLRRSFGVLAVTLLVVPTLFPWYVIWLLPLMPLIGRRPSWAFVLLAGLVVLLYTYYIGQIAYWWTPLAEYVPFYAVLAWEYARWRRSRPPPTERTVFMDQRHLRFRRVSGRGDAPPERSVA